MCIHVYSLYCFLKPYHFCVSINIIKIRNGEQCGAVIVEAAQPSALGDKVYETKVIVNVRKQ